MGTCHKHQQNFPHGFHYRHNYETKYKLNLSIGNQAVTLDPFPTLLGI